MGFLKHWFRFEKVQNTRNHFSKQHFFLSSNFEDSKMCGVADLNGVLTPLPILIPPIIEVEQSWDIIKTNEK